MQKPFATFQRGNSPLLAAAVHNGHDLSPEAERRMALDESARLREEDPFTGRWTVVADNRVIGHYSRFEVDLNRPREKAIYRTPDDAWGLTVWSDEPPAPLVEQSLANYDTFYAQVRKTLDTLVARHGCVLTLDLHTYNHRRDGDTAQIADPAKNPEINLGTGTMDRQRWAPVVDRFLEELADYDFLGRRLDVRENVRFQGGHFPRWIHQSYPESACALAIEVKKFFMDEWTGELDQRQFTALEGALRTAASGALEALSQLMPRQFHDARA